MVSVADEPLTRTPGCSGSGADSLATRTPV